MYAGASRSAWADPVTLTPMPARRSTCPLAASACAIVKAGASALGNTTGPHGAPSKIATSQADARKRSVSSAAEKRGSNAVNESSAVCTDAGRAGDLPRVTELRLRSTPIVLGGTAKSFSRILVNVDGNAEEEDGETARL